ncbi:hypothetical protein CBER1_11878 [Cercospora berteroae]|uniref:Tyrosinase copper-binding domain-containing protein n=1 Tax=Cercospora berteroae TaxID=357750 RepID=A0A2S6CI03_9PEZI|nr:hypothetical protein CBER1_11878 [Cercospora berteroae]
MYVPVGTLSLLLASAANAVPINEQSNCACSSPRIRKEWRTLSSFEQEAYIDAIKCLKNSPSKGREIFNTLESRYDDFVAIHINATRGGQDAPSLADLHFSENSTQRPPTIYGIHGVGVFLPWHRYALWTFESVLRSECNFTGTQPYWDWTLDNPASNGSLLGSPVITSFGGDGIGSSGCVPDGPFNGSTFLNIGPVDSLARNPRCLTRFLSEDLFTQSGKWERIYPPTMSRTGYVQLQQFIDDLSFVPEDDTVTSVLFANPHGLGHSGVGGDMLDVYASPNDPIFWLHHAQLDYMWALWQKDDKARLVDIGGARTVQGFGPDADHAEPTTLDTPVWMGFMNEDVTVKAVMDTVNEDGEGVLCYEYDDSPSLEGRDL